MASQPRPAPAPARTLSARVTSHDVARAAGVSQSTVSRALRGDTSVAEPTRLRIVQTADALGYTPSQLGRNLVTRRTRTVGMVVTDLGNPFYPYLIAPLHDELVRRGYRLLLIADDSGGTGVDEPLERLLEGSIDGAVLTTTGVDSELPAQLAARGLPFVFLARVAEGVAADASVVDNALGASLMATECLRLGHRRFAAVLGPAEASTSRERARGLRAALGAAGVELDPALVSTGPFEPATGDAATERLLAADPRPTVIVCGNDMIAIGALNAARRLGVRVPEDVSVVGFDDLPIAAWDLVGLTTMHQPMNDMARTAARLVVERIEGTTGAGRVHRRVFEPRLVLRRTLGPPPGA